jgi:S-adenosylmethionine-dependent methyltransferase
MVEEAVRRYYASRVKDEWKRQFDNPYARLEYDTTLYFIDKYLSGEKKLILDAGGGPGGYTLELARRGHHLVLLDPVVENLEFASMQLKRAGLLGQVNDIVEGSIEDLSVFPDSTFDLVLCLGGPLSHIMEEKGRAKAARELVRVLDRRGLLFVAVISRLSSLVLELETDFRYAGVTLFKRLRDKGDYHGEHIFTAFHGFLPDELRKLFAETGSLKVLEMVGLEGIGSTHSEAVNKIAKKKALWNLWVKTHYLTCTEPSTIGVAEHILLIARKQ